jgi:predicted alpha/beta-fold hydrolase
VHGIGGDSYSTWTHPQSKKLWLRDFLPQVEAFRNARILTFGYNARIFVSSKEHKTTDRIFTFGESLLVSLSDVRVERAAKNRPILFIGHSLGGLIIKSVGMIPNRLHLQCWPFGERLTELWLICRHLSMRKTDPRCMATSILQQRLSYSSARPTPELMRPHGLAIWEGSRKPLA